MAYAARSNGIELSFFARLREIGEQVRDAYQARKLYRRTLTELEALSVRDLADMGLSPWMIRDIAFEAAYGKQA